VLELDHLTKHYDAVGGDTVRAVDGVSLAVKPGEMVALYGPSGSGKTTLLLMIATLLEPTSGTVSIAGRDVSYMSEREASQFRLSQLGFIRQNFDLLPGVTAIDNAVLKLLKQMRWRDAHRQITPLLDALGLGERLSHRAETLSMGEKQRVMIARALSTEPSLLLADEPTGSLDTQRSREVLELLRELCREREVAVVLVSHDPLAAGYADRVYALRDGKLSDYQPEAVASLPARRGDALSRGDEDAPIRIVAYDKSWPHRFATEQALLETVIREWVTGGIHHVGSTAVPGLAAKPVIDILVGVEDLAASRASFEKLARIGYVHAPYRETEMHWFCKPSPRRRTHHLHLVPTDSPRFREELAFRDLLRARPDVAADYVALKRELASRHEHDRDAYTDGKQVFVAQALRDARAVR